MRQRGEDVFFLTGTDEHGEPVAQAAERLGHHAAGARRPQRGALQGADAARSTSPTTSSSAPPTREHKAKVAGGRAAHPRQRARLPGHLRGLVLPALRGLQDRDRGRGRQHAARSTRSRSSARRRRTGSSGCPPSRSRSSSSTRSSPDFVMPRNRYNEALSFIKRRPAATSRSAARKLTWGVPVPWDPSRTSSTSGSTRCSTTTRRSRYARDGEDLTEQLLAGDVHLIGKDILKFHAVYLAGDADGGRTSRCPQQRLHPRLPADGTSEQDVASRSATCSTRSR